MQGEHDSLLAMFYTESSDSVLSDSSKKNKQPTQQGLLEGCFFPQLALNNGSFRNCSVSQSFHFFPIHSKCIYFQMPFKPEDFLCSGM